MGGKKRNNSKAATPGPLSAPAPPGLPLPASTTALTNLTNPGPATDHEGDDAATLRARASAAAATLSGQATRPPDGDALARLRAERDALLVECGRLGAERDALAATAGAQAVTPSPTVAGLLEEASGLKAAMADALRELDQRTAEAVELRARCTSAVAEAEAVAKRRMSLAEASLERERERVAELEALLTTATAEAASSRAAAESAAADADVARAQEAGTGAEVRRLRALMAVASAETAGARDDAAESALCRAAAAERLAGKLAAEVDDLTAAVNRGAATADDLRRRLAAATAGPPVFGPPTHGAYAGEGDDGAETGGHGQAVGHSRTSTRSSLWADDDDDDEGEGGEGEARTPPPPPKHVVKAPAPPRRRVGLFGYITGYDVAASPVAPARPAAAVVAAGPVVVLAPPAVEAMAADDVNGQREPA